MVGNLASNAICASLPEKISFQNIVENKDISLGDGGALLQDSEGFMWLGGSNALIRYDGYEFRQFDVSASDDKPDEKVAIKFVQDLFEDKQKMLWVATQYGVYHYDPTQEKILKLKDDPSQPLKITTSAFLRIKQLPSGEIIACSFQGLFVIDPISLKYTTIVFDENEKNGLHSQRVNTAYIDKDNQLWLGTEAGLEKVDWKTKTFTLLKPDALHPELVADNRVADIIADSNQQFWLATSNGLVHFDPLTLQSTRYLHDPNDPYSLGANDVWKMLIDSQGILWIASDGGGVSVFDKERNRFINYKYEEGRVGSINSNQVRTIIEDKSGDIWTGNYPVGVNFFDRSTAAITSYSRDSANPNSLSHNAVLSIQEDKRGNLWLGTDGGGLNFFNRETGGFTHFAYNPNDPNTLNGDAVLDTFMDSDGLIWTGVWGGGIASFDPVEKTFTRYPFDNRRKTTERVTTSYKLNSAHAWSIREDANHDLWISTFTGGISKFNRKTKLFTHYMHVENDPESLSAYLAWCTFEDSKGNFWVGTNNGLNLMNREKETFSFFVTNPQDPTSLSNPSVIVIFEDSKQRLWAGTDAGLNLFHPETKNFTVYGKKDGFLDDTIRSIVEDEHGILWIGTNNGFSSFDVENKKIKNYNRIGGRLIGGFKTGSAIVSHRGEVVLGGVNGLRLFKPEELTENKIPPAIALTDFKIFSDSLKVNAADGILKSAINHSSEITLDYKKSMFTVAFSALNFRDSVKNKYAFKLDGFDRDWLDAGNLRQAKYTNLDAGVYTFHVKGSNNDGVWNDVGKTITIVQLPPPWKTWWAYTCYGLLVLSLLCWFWYAQRKKRQLVEEQNRLLEIKVAERTAEVREKNKNIQVMLSNMPQGLFTVQTGGVIHPEYSLFLESIFETDVIAGRNVRDLLFSGAEISSDALDSCSAAISSMIDEDEMNYEFNQGLLVGEYDILIIDKKKHLTLDWSPIVLDGIVNKLMVSVRDVTRLVQMERSALQQQRQLEIVSQLLNVPVDKYLKFEESALRYVAANREAISQCTQYDSEVIALLFRNMHTLKGNSRTFGFSHLSTRVHDVESTYSVLKSLGEKQWSPEFLLKELELVEKDLAEYAHVYRVVLGRGDDSSRGQKDGFWMKNRVMQRIQSLVKDKRLSDLENYLGRINAVSIEQNLADVIASLQSIASQLDKKNPAVRIQAKGVYILEAGQELMHDIFAHIFRNCVDHGLETTAERVRMNKSEHGQLQLNAIVEDELLKMSVQDDGRGLNLRALFKKGVELGRWREDDKPTAADIAELVFASGVSTKEQISDISGRGVGMDAVKQFLNTHGGDVKINLLGDTIENNGFLPFELVVYLPANLFFHSQESQDPDELIA